MASARPVPAAGPEGETTLQVTRRFKAPREAVFKAFTDPETLRRWWGPPGFTCPVARVDARPGGRYYIEMVSPTGSVHRLGGTFREVSPPGRLVYTWAWLQGETPGHETLVTIELHAVGGETELRLRHDGFESTSSRDSHRGGWTGCFDRLEAMAAAMTPSGNLGGPT